MGRRADTSLPSGVGADSESVDDAEIHCGMMGWTSGHHKHAPQSGLLIVNGG